MRILIASLATIAMSLAAECPPSPPPTPDASDAGHRDAGPSPNATPTQRACGNLASLGCAEGVDDKCVVVLDRAIAARLTTFNLACLASAKTKAEIRACPPANVACP